MLHAGATARRIGAEQGPCGKQKRRRGDRERLDLQREIGENPAG